MIQLQIASVDMNPGNGTHEAITHVGGPDGGGWRWTVGEVVLAIEADSHSFYVVTFGGRADVKVVGGSRGKYLRAQVKGNWNDSLLMLPPCP